MKYQLLYQILSTINQSRTISEVADQLYLSQPYVSQVIAKTESKYQVKLVNRKTMPIQLTEAGHQMVKDLERLLNDQAVLKQNLSPYKLKNDDRIRITVTPIWISEIMSNVLSELQTTFPEVNFEIQQVFTSTESVKMLETRTTDIFWGSTLHMNHFISNYLYRSQACIIIPPNHPLYQKGKVKVPFTDEKIAVLNDSKMISLTQNSAFQSIVDHFFEDAKINLTKVMEVNSFLGAASLAAHGLGISVVLTDILPYLDDSLNFNVIQIPKPDLNLDVGITIHEESSNKVKEVSQALQEIIKKYMQPSNLT